MVKKSQNDCLRFTQSENTLRLDSVDPSQVTFNTVGAQKTDYGKNMKLLF